MPQLMKAVVMPAHGGREVLSYGELEKPLPGKGEVLVKVAFTGVNHVDLVNRRGYPGITVPLPHVLGSDIAGTIAELGEGVDGLTVGSPVVVYPLIGCGNCSACNEGRANICLNWKFIGLHLRGGYGEYVSVPAQNVIPLSIPFDKAMAIPVAGLTAYHALKNVGELRSGQTFFIWGGAGGLGSMAIQIARHLGARVIATGGTPEKLETMKRLGADFVLDRRQDDVIGEVKKIAPDGVDLILDYVGPETFPKSFGMLKKGATMLLCGIITGRETTVSLHQTYLRHLSIKGLYMGTMTEMRELLALVEAGNIKPHIGRVLPLQDAAEGHRLMEAGESIGKIALRVS
jgi:NADPH:quinone reductase-like Zn-dependent oxidoreductase